MDREDRDRLVRIETILTESIVPRINDYSKRIKVLEGVAKTATILGGVALGGIYFARDVAVEWIKNRMAHGTH